MLARIDTFVKGDVVASILIVSFNALGGLAIGVAMRGMTADALRRYGLLTIGDGLVTQIRRSSCRRPPGSS